MADELLLKDSRLTCNAATDDFRTILQIVASSALLSFPSFTFLVSIEVPACAFLSGLIRFYTISTSFIVKLSISAMFAQVLLGGALFGAVLAQGPLVRRLSWVNEALLQLTPWIFLIIRIRSSIHLPQLLCKRQHNRSCRSVQQP